MAATVGPKIGGIQDNLQYFQDPALGKSYNGGNTTINLAKNSQYNSLNATGNLVSGSYYSTLGKGSFYFDGINDQIRFDQGANVTNPLLLPTVCTVYAWVYPLSSTFDVFSHWSSGPVNLAYGIESGKIYVTQYTNPLSVGWKSYLSSGSSVSTHTWSQIAWVRNNNATMSLYLNDNLNATILADTANGHSFSGGNQGVLGSSWYRYANGYLGVFMIYFEAHDLTKVQQTYNIFRGRYNV